MTHEGSRASPAGGPVRRVDTAAALPAAAWDALLGPGDFYLSSAWLRLAEDIRHLRALYITAGSPPGASLVAHLVDAGQAPSSQTRVDKVLARVLPQDEPPSGLEQLLPSLVCGGLLTTHSRVPVDPRLPAADRAAMTTDLLAAAEATARRLGARSLAALMVDATDTVLVQSLASAGFRSFPNGECARLDVRWSSFDEYLDSLGVHRRGSVRQEIRALEQAGVSISTAPLSTDLVPSLARLELELLRRYRSAREPATVERSLQLLAARLGETAIVAVARLAGRPCGFLLLLPWRDELHARNVGFDYAAQGRLPLYFGTCFYEPIRHAISHGWRVIDYGSGSGQAKAARGCRLVPQRLHVKGLEPVLQHLLDRLADPPPEADDARGREQQGVADTTHREYNGHP